MNDPHHAPTSHVRAASLALSLASAALFACIASSVASAQCGTYATNFGVSDLDGTVFALAEFDDGTGNALYAGGAFRHASGETVEHIARWDGERWTSVGGGVNGNVNALCVFDDGTGPALYVGGTFTFVAANTLPALRFARWNGSTWSTLGAAGSGTPGVSGGFANLTSVNALLVYDDGPGGAAPVLAVGGNFSLTNGIPASDVARWDGTTLAPWSTQPFDLPVTSLAAYGTGPGGSPELYAGGRFTTIGGLSRRAIARWDGTSWTGLGTGIDAPSVTYVSSLGVYDGGNGPELYAGGSFRTAGGVMSPSIARWNGSAWSDVGGGVGFGSGSTWRNVNALLVFDPGSVPLLYATGDFSTAGGAAIQRVASWNGAGWSAVTSVLSPVLGNALCAHDDGTGLGTTLFVGGSTTAFLGSFGNVERVAGTIATALSPTDALDVVVNDFVVFDDGSGGGRELYASGLDPNSPSVQSPVVRWDGEEWTDLPAPVGAVNGLFVHDGGSGAELYAAANPIQRWNGASWMSIATVAGTGAFVDGFATFDDDGPGGAAPKLYVGGRFDSVAGVAAKGIAAWDGTTWSPLGAGINYVVLDMLVHDDGSGEALYVCGDFQTAGGAFMPSIARWDGTTWSSLGAGLGGQMFPIGNAMTTFDDGSGLALYCVGSFTAAGNNLANRIAKWDGSTWSALGAGLSQDAYALAVWDDGSGGGPALYAGGTFTVAGGIAANRVARWDGSAWSSLGAGTSAQVNALEVFDDGHGGPALFLGGVFREAGGIPAHSVTRFDGCRMTSFCAGDGTLVTPCPCANSGAAGRGCAWSGNAQGALLEASGRIDPDTLVLHASGMSLSSSSTIFLKGDAADANGVVFGDGVRCVDGTLVRLGIKTNVNGEALYPEPGNLSVSVRGGTPVGSGSVGFYQTYFRTASPTFCPPATFNVTNGVRLVW